MEEGRRGDRLTEFSVRFNVPMVPSKLYQQPSEPILKIYYVLRRLARSTRETGAPHPHNPI